MNAICDEWVSKDGQHRIILGDCLQVLPLLDTSEISGILADPPYGIDVARGGGRLGSNTSKAGIKGREYTAVAGDCKPFDPSPWLKFDDLILWGGNWFADKLPPRGRWLVWDKRNGVASNNMADCELAWTSSNAPARLKPLRWMGMIRDTEKASTDRVHTTQKPVALMIWCLSFLPSGLILDPFAGSCTVAVACARTGRKSISIEIERKYWEIGCARMEREESRFPLFTTQQTQGELFQ